MLVTQLIIIIVILLIITGLVVISTRRTSPPKEKTSSYKLITIGEHFRSLSGLNLGHAADSPIFHAHPWFGKRFGSGIGEYLGAVKIKPGRALCLTFPTAGQLSYEVNIFGYPSWDQLTPTLYCPTRLYIGPGKTNNIITTTEIVVIVSGIASDKEIRNKWLSHCDVQFVRPPSSRIDLTAPALPVASDDQYYDEIKKHYDEFMSEYDYINITDMVSSSEPYKFPPSLGAVESLRYTPSEIGVNILIIQPNRVLTLGAESAFFIEIRGARKYFTSSTKSRVNFYMFTATATDEIYMEERFLVKADDHSLLLPFYVYIFKT